MPSGLSKSLGFFFFIFATFFFSGAKPYIERGDQVDTRYKAYFARFQKNYQDLVFILRNEAPDLFEKIKKRPPISIGYGYGLIPKITAPSKAPPPSHAVTTSYSWNRTDSFLDSEIPKIDELEQKLRSLKALGPKDRRIILEKIISDYPQLESNQRIIEDHIKYNRFWQNSVEHAKDYFSRGGMPEFRLPAYVSVRKEKSNWIIEVPVYTDIVNSSFKKQFKKIVEEKWKLDEPNLTFKIRMLLKTVAPLKVKQGSHIDLGEHVKSFPQDGAILTTGAQTTHAIAGHYIALGPQNIDENTLAHEFGHLLGFADGYLRKFRDQGKDGYEILEIIPDPEDIMCTPDLGRVMRHHFEQILKASTRKKN